MSKKSKDKDLSSYRAKLVVGFVLESLGVSTAQVTAEQLLRAERCADFVLGKQDPKAH